MYAYLKGSELLVCCFNLSADAPQEIRLSEIYPVSDGWTVWVDSLADPEFALVSAAQGGRDWRMLQPHQGIVFYHPRIKP